MGCEGLVMSQAGEFRIGWLLVLSFLERTRKRRGGTGASWMPWQRQPSSFHLSPT